MTGACDVWFNVFKDAKDLWVKVHILDAWYASHGGQGLAVTRHCHVRLEHQGRGQTEGF